MDKRRTEEIKKQNKKSKRIERGYNSNIVQLPGALQCFLCALGENERFSGIMRHPWQARTISRLPANAIV